MKQKLKIKLRTLIIFSEQGKEEIHLTTLPYPKAHLSSRSAEIISEVTVRESKKWFRTAFQPPANAQDGYRYPLIFFGCSLALNTFGINDGHASLAFV